MVNPNLPTIIRLLILYLLRESIGDNSSASYQTNFLRTNAITNKSLSPKVIIPNVGALKGRQSITSNRRFYEFRGIKYAEAPIGANRFKAPIPAKPWQGIRNAQHYARNCSNLKSLMHSSDAERNNIDLEDCLHLDVYSTNTNFIDFKTNNFDLVPVMVYVHGGSFRNYNSPDFQPHYLMRRNIVLVVMNYRLDAFGFLSTLSAAVPGNAGVLDVILALKWVKSNIRYFGGNSESITLFGQSCGAVMVSSLVVSPIVPKNLFDNVIIQSGSVLAPWAIAEDPVSYAFDIARRVDASLMNASIAELNEAFIKMPVYDLLKATEDHYNENVALGSNKVGGRSLVIGGPSNLLPDTPINLMRNGNYPTNISMIAGVTKNEGTFLTATVYDILEVYHQKFNAQFTAEQALDIVIQALGVGRQMKKYVNTVNSLYFGNKHGRKHRANNNNAFAIAMSISDLMGTVAFKEPVFEFARHNAKYNPGRTFLYTFDYAGKRTRYGFNRTTSKYPFDSGVCHTDDLIYLLPTPSELNTLTGSDTQIMEKMVDLWTSFATTFGQPIIAANPKFRWIPMMTNYGPYLHIDERFRFGWNFTLEYRTGDGRL